MQDCVGTPVLCTCPESLPGPAQCTMLYTVSSLRMLFMWLNTFFFVVMSFTAQALPQILVPCIGGQSRHWQMFTAIPMSVRTIRAANFLLPQLYAYSLPFTGRLHALTVSGDQHLFSPVLQGKMWPAPTSGVSCKWPLHTSQGAGSRRPRFFCGA